MADLEDKIVVITGGSSGIGRVTAELFAEHKAKVFNLDIQKPSSNISRIEHIHCDVSKYSDVQEAFKKIINQEMKLDCVFANAGQYLCATLENTLHEDMERIINVNLKGTLYTLQNALPIMKAQKYGSIILMGSDQSFVGRLESSIYGATKGAIAQLTKSTAIDYAKYNIRVNCVCPGSIETPLYHQVIDIFSQKEKMEKKAVHEMFSAEYPSLRIGKPEEVARLVAFLSSDHTSFMTGALISVDGGYTAK